jgi:hypothetical protein
MEEIRKDIYGFEGKYEVSNTWKVRWLNLLKPQPNEKWYLKVGLSNGHWKKKKCRVHRLVAYAFIPNPDNKLEINHKNGDKTDNCIDNLEWIDHRDNLIHGREVLWKWFWLQFKWKFWAKHPQSIPIKQINKHTSEVMKIRSSTSDVVRELWIAAPQISNCLRKKPNFNTAGWFKREYATD